MQFANFTAGLHKYGTSDTPPEGYENLSYVSFYDPTLEEHLRGERKNEIEKVMYALALCHSLIIDEEGKYSASSPDELAFA